MSESIKYIKQYLPALLSTVLLFVVTQCKDFEDCRTPYKSTVTVVFKPVKGETQANVPIDSIKGAEANQGRVVSKVGTSYALPLDPHANSIEFTINRPPFTDTLTIHYERVVSLISPQCGAQQEYILKEVKSTFSRQPKILLPKLSSFDDSDPKNPAPNVEVYF